MDEQSKSVARLIGDFLREAAVLVLVFYPIDLLRDVDTGHPLPLSVNKILWASGLLLAFGIALEKVDFGGITVKLLDVTLRYLFMAREFLVRRRR